MTYELAIAAAMTDQDMYTSATISQDADNRRIVLINKGEIVAVYPYKD